MLCNVLWFKGTLFYRQTPVEVQQETHKIPYVKKPQNAFMLFMKEQRPNIAPELWRKGSGAVNAVLGKMVWLIYICITNLIKQFSLWKFILDVCAIFCPQWKSLSKEEQSKYFVEAETERMLHKMEHPEWTNRENYVSTRCLCITVQEQRERYSKGFLLEGSQICMGTNMYGVCVCVCVCVVCKSTWGYNQSQNLGGISRGTARNFGPPEKYYTGPPLRHHVKQIIL